MFRNHNIIGIDVVQNILHPTEHFVIVVDYKH